MIPLPYKLNLILTSDYTKRDYTTIPNNKINSIDKNSLSRLTNFYEVTNSNKLKDIILNLGLSEKKYLVSQSSTGIDIIFEVTNHDRISNSNYEDYVVANGILGPINITNNNEIKKIIGDIPNLTYLVIQPITVEQIDIDQFIDKWNDDKNKFDIYLPEILIYGSIFNEIGEFLSNYYITPKYFDYKDIIKMNWNLTIDYFKKILIMLDTVVKFGFIYRNLSIFGIGFEVYITPDSPDKNNTIRVKILKYTTTLLLSLEDKHFKQFESTKCFGKDCIGNLIPYYVIDDYYNLRNDWVRRLDKSYSLGLVEIIFVLFYNNCEILSKLYNFIIGPSVLESRLQYFHMHK